VIAVCDVLAIGAHPDDVELGCGATIARLAAAGRRVGILDLTAGEVATRGDPDTRTREALSAARALGAAWRACLALPDGGLAAGDRAQLTAVVAALRTAMPRALLVQHPGDPHPDHQAGASLVQAATFLAGVMRWEPEAGAPSRPRLALSFPGPRQLLEPTLVVDVTGQYHAKRAALGCYRSQLDPSWRPPQRSGTFTTQLSTSYFLAAIEGRDRAAGNAIACEFGEGFTTAEPAAADELVWLLGGNETDLEGHDPKPGVAGRRT
jgi:N-acetylglucosamine malate deacetylase 1